MNKLQGITIKHIETLSKKGYNSIIRLIGASLTVENASHTLSILHQIENSSIALLESESCTTPMTSCRKG